MKWAFSADLARHKGWQWCEKILLTLNLPETHLLQGWAGHVLPHQGALAAWPYSAAFFLLPALHTRRRPGSQQHCFQKEGGRI